MTHLPHKPIPLVPGAVGQRARERDAQRYVTAIHPLVAAVAAFGTLLDQAFGPRSAVAAESAAVGILIVTLGPLIVALRAGWLTPMRAIYLALLGDFAALATLVCWVPHPEVASCTLVLVVPLLGYFTSARTILVCCTAIAALISIGGPQLSGWGDHAVIPWSAFTVFLGGLLAAFVWSRMRATERVLERVASNERDARHQLELVDKARERLIANVSHELRTPLTSTVGSIDTLLRGDIQLDEGRRVELLRLAHDGGLRLLSLVEDLLTLGATRPDSLHLAPEAESLEQLVNEAVAGIVPADGRSVIVRSSGTTSVVVDRLRMMQVIANLVTNGLRHGSGNVVVLTEVNAHGATIRVHDDGPGVPPEHVDELFLPFARFSTRPDSTGLGLAISRTIVEAHGGRIRYGRTPDHHTEFAVELPRATTAV